jgi:hypothetical protein
LKPRLGRFGPDGNRVQAPSFGCGDERQGGPSICFVFKGLHRCAVAFAAAVLCNYKYWHPLTHNIRNAAPARTAKPLFQA